MLDPGVLMGSATQIYLTVHVTGAHRIQRKECFWENTWLTLLCQSLHNQPEGYFCWLWKRKTFCVLWFWLSVRKTARSSPQACVCVWELPLPAQRVHVSMSAHHPAQPDRTCHCDPGSGRCGRCWRPVHVVWTGTHWSRGPWGFSSWGQPVCT